MTHCLVPLLPLQMFCPLTAESGTFLGHKHTPERCGSVVEINEAAAQSVCRKTSLQETYFIQLLESHKTADFI